MIIFIIMMKTINRCVTKKTIWLIYIYVLSVLSIHVLFN